MSDERTKKETFKLETGKDVNKAPDDVSVKLKRELGLFSAVMYIIGVMIGSGVFVSPASTLKHSGSVGLCLVIWTLSGFISLLGALAYAELSTVVNKSGAEYAYFQEAFRKCDKFLGPIPAFCFAFLNVLILRPAEVAVVIMTFAAYIIQPFAGELAAESRLRATQLMALLALFVMTYINIVSVKLFVKVQNVFGVCKVLACVVVIGGGIYEINKGNTKYLEKGFEGSDYNPGSIALALYSGLWAYDGWNSITVITEEIINPGRNIPFSIIIAVPLITALYVSMNVAYMAVLNYAEMTSVPAVAVTFAERSLGSLAFVIPLGVAISTFGCCIAVQFGVTRVCYIAAQHGHMLEVFSYIHMKRMTPAPAVALQGILTAVFICMGDIQSLIEFASWFLWLFYGFAMVALLVLRKTQPDKRRPYRVPTAVPYFVLAVAIFLSVLPIIRDPSVKYLAAITFVFLALIFYTICIYYNKTPKRLLAKFTFLTQVLFLSVPPSKHED